MKFRAAACLYAALTLALAASAGVAYAGDGHGNGGGDAAHGKSSTHQSQSADQSHQQTPTTTSDDNSTGVKPSNTTTHDTKVPASSNETKQYGNGKTAGEIATAAGYGDSKLHGPGNSQPHKVNCGAHEVDVHALKHKPCGASQQPAEHAQAAPQKVTLCHKTGSATNPYVEITVSVNALKHGHTTAKGDIIPAPASGCPTTAEVQSTSESQSHVTSNTRSSTNTSSSTDTSSSNTSSTRSSSVLAVSTQRTAVSTQSTRSTQGMQSTRPTSKAAPAPAGSVLGATHALAAKPKSKPAAGGVLGTTVRLGRSVGSKNLPFTGLPLWIFALVAAGLIAVGAFARRAGAPS